MPASDRIDALAPAAPARGAGNAGGYRGEFSRALLLAAAFAILFFAAFPPVNIWPLALLAPAPLAWLAATAASTRIALVATLFVSFAMWLWLGLWLIQITTLGYPGYALGMSLYLLLFVWLFRRLARHERFKSLPYALLLPIAWVGVEAFRGEVAFNGYPWFLVGHPLIEGPILVQSADLVGAYGISVLAAMMAGAVLDLLRAQRGVLPARQVRLIAVTAAALFALNLGYGVWRLNQQDVLEPGPSILAVQTNMPQDNKLRSTMEERIAFFDGFMRLTIEGYLDAASRDQPVDLVAWPETMVFGFGLEPETIAFTIEHQFFPEDWFARELAFFVRETGTPMLVGSPVYEDLEWPAEGRPWRAHYNSAYLMTEPDVFERYDKVFLTPFGETMPYISRWPWLEQRLLSLGAHGMQFDLDPGESMHALRLPWQGRTLHVGAPICFEVTVSRVCRRMVNNAAGERADMLVNLSNDSWFGWYKAGRNQHAQIARFRCIENRVPMIRSVNSGNSVSIDTRGRVIDVIGDGRYGTANVGGTLLAQVELDHRVPLYSRIGNVPAWFCLMLSIAGLVFTVRARRERSSPR